LLSRHRLMRVMRTGAAPKYDVAAKAGCGANSANARRPPPRGIMLGVGDVVSITIFESLGGLFFPNDAGARPGNFVTLPNQMADSNGNITVPYAGIIRAGLGGHLLKFNKRSSKL
jgi:protein involved in polysaccharide export with SLBB domain